METINIIYDLVILSAVIYAIWGIRVHKKRIDKARKMIREIEMHIDRLESKVIIRKIIKRKLK